MEPFVSIILPVYNQEKYIAETIESVLSQTFSNFEFLILDDGSTDNSAQIIRMYASKDNRIIPYFEKNAGRCIATNNLVFKARGKWCALLDADDLMLPTRLEKQVAFHMGNPEVNASSCHCYYINENGQVLGIQRYPGLSTADEARKSILKKESMLCAITGVMVRKTAFLDSGGLRSQFWPCDDFEFVNRFLEKNYLLVILQEILMKYRIHTASITGQKPLHTIDMTDYVGHCIDLRRSGHPEITIDEFMKHRRQEAWWIKVNRRRFNYSQMYLRSAHFALNTKQYLNFSWQLGVASFLSPNYVFASLMKRFTIK